MGTTEIISAMTLGAVVLSGLVNLTSLVGKRESKAAADARVEVKLDSIINKVDSIEKKQDGIEGVLREHSERITVVEQSTKSAHLRINEIVKGG